MERKIEIMPPYNLESVVNALLAAKERGEQAYCDFNGHILHSDTISMDSAYIEVTGYTKAEYEQKSKEQYEKQIASNPQEIEKNAISRIKVINGLKFIVENPSLSQEELFKGLLELGCNFSLEDINRQFPNEIKLMDGIKRGDISCGAKVIVNARDSELGREFCYSKLLGIDDDMSIYHFIRIVTGDETYTKENIDALNNSGMHK